MWQVAKNNSGWWFFATPLKNDEARQLGWLFHSQYDGKVIKKHVPKHQPELVIAVVIAGWSSNRRRLTHFFLGVISRVLYYMAHCDWIEPHGNPILRHEEWHTVWKIAPLGGWMDNDDWKTRGFIDHRNNSSDPDEWWRMMWMHPAQIQWFTGSFKRLSPISLLSQFPKRVTIQGLLTLVFIVQVTKTHDLQYIIGHRCVCLSEHGWTWGYFFVYVFLFRLCNR